MPHDLVCQKFVNTFMEFIPLQIEKIGMKTAFLFFKSEAEVKQLLISD